VTRAVEFTIEPAEAGARLDAVLAARLSLSRAAARRLLEGGAVRVDGRRTRERAKGRPVEVGSKVEITSFTPPGDERPLADPALPLRVLAEGPGWLALDKPAGVPVHPLAPDETGTLLNALIARRPEVAGVGEGGLRSGVVHRLDVDTSGVLVFATDEPTWQRLRDAFSSHRVTKRYRALVRGAPPETGRAELWLTVGAHRPARVRIVASAEPGARRARLAWRTLERFAAAALVEVELETGFLHQVRVSFAHLGHPVLGDLAYGGEPAPGEPAVTRQMLHAAQLAVDEIDASSPDPADFAACLVALRGGAAPGSPAPAGGARVSPAPAGVASGSAAPPGSTSGSADGPA